MTGEGRPAFGVSAFARPLCFGAPAPPAVRPGVQRAGLQLPAVVGERLVRFRHPVRVVLLLHRVALTLRGGDQLSREPVAIVFSARAASTNEPPMASAVRRSGRTSTGT